MNVTWIYKNQGLYIFNDNEGIPDKKTWREAVTAVAEKYAETFEDHDIVYCRNDGMMSVMSLEEAWAELSIDIIPLPFKAIGELAQKAVATQAKLRAGEDPAAERAILMRLHRVSWDEAVRRWPLSDYASWRRSGL